MSFLTGKRFWFQTAFCCWSLSDHARDEITPQFIDDGTFDSALAGECRRLFPNASIRSAGEIQHQLDQYLPAEVFPTLRALRQTYVHLRKLTDVHVGRKTWGVVLDSDMLFFRTPVLLLDWLHRPDAALHMFDVKDAYGYSFATLQAMTSAPVPHAVNVGITGLNADAIDWVQFETWCADLLRRHGSSYYLEQAVIALWLAQQRTTCLPRADYVVMPDIDECRAPKAILHHYVDLSKRGYFRHAWKHVGDRSQSTLSPVVQPRCPNRL